MFAFGLILSLDLQEKVVLDLAWTRNRRQVLVDSRILFKEECSVLSHVGV